GQRIERRAEKFRRFVVLPTFVIERAEQNLELRPRFSFSAGLLQRRNGFRRLELAIINLPQQQLHGGGIRPIGFRLQRLNPFVHAFDLRVALIDLVERTILKRIFQQHAFISLAHFLVARRIGERISRRGQQAAIREEKNQNEKCEPNTCSERFHNFPFLISHISAGAIRTTDSPPNPDVAAPHQSRTATTPLPAATAKVASAPAPLPPARRGTILPSSGCIYRPSSAPSRAGNSRSATGGDTPVYTKS